MYQLMIINKLIVTIIVITCLFTHFKIPPNIDPTMMRRLENIRFNTQFFSADQIATLVLKKKKNITISSNHYNYYIHPFKMSL